MSSNNDHATIESLPREVMDSIIREMNVGDAINVGAIMGGVAVEQRLDPCKYLSRTFKHSTSLLAAMADYGCVIGGARAADYFSSSRANEGTKWNFFCPPSIAASARMVNILSACGVEWYCNVAGLQNLLDGRVGAEEKISVMRLHHATRAMAALTNNRYEESLSRVREFVCLIRSMAHRSDAAASPSFNTHGMITVRRMDGMNTRSEHKLPNVSVDVEIMRGLGLTRYPDVLPFHGKIKNNKGSTEEVCLMVCYRRLESTISTLRMGDRFTERSVIEAATQQWISCATCFITGWCAVQVFPEEDDKKVITRTGTEPMDRPNSTDRYRMNGYSLQEYTSPNVFTSVVHSAAHSNIRIVPFLKTYAADEGEASPLQRDVRNMFQLGLESVAGLAWHRGASGYVKLGEDEGLRLARRGIMNSDEAAKRIVGRRTNTVGLYVQEKYKSHAPDRVCSSGVFSNDMLILAVHRLVVNGCTDGDLRGEMSAFFI